MKVFNYAGDHRVSYVIRGAVLYDLTVNDFYQLSQDPKPDPSFAVGEGRHDLGHRLVGYNQLKRDLPGLIEGTAIEAVISCAPASVIRIEEQGVDPIRFRGRADMEAYELGPGCC